jgi:hypothetical protein
MEVNIKEIIKQEYIKCLKDPTHFLNKYCYIQHPIRGRIPFNLYPFQDKLIKLWENNQYSIILKSRQLGISTLVAGYSLWLMLFHKDKNILCIATKEKTAKNMVSKAKFMFNNLPSWLKIQAEEENKLALKLSNGSIIQATSAASDAGRSEAVSLLIIDEGAFIENIEDIWTSSQQTLSTGGDCIILSTPNGTGNWFHKMWAKAEIKEQNDTYKFTPIKLPWWVHPERDETWRKGQDILLGDSKKAAQECDADFNTSGDTVFYSEWIDFILSTTIKEPLERRGIDQNLWIWEPVDYSREYMIIADVARGDGADYSACHVIDIITNTQVAEYKGQLPPKEFGYFLVGLATEYNNALLIVENSGVGWSTLDSIIERGYRNLYYSSKSDNFNADSYLRMYEGNSEMVPGFTMSLRSRPLVINKFREFISDRSTIIQSKRLIEEMKVFIWKNGRAQAQNGYNDDLIMAYAVGMFLRDTSLRFQQHSLDMTRAALQGIQKITSNNSGVYTRTGNFQDPYKIKNPYGGDEDIRWLLNK